MTQKMSCYCPGRHAPHILCAVCVPAKCRCGRHIPAETLRYAYKRTLGVRCTACGERKTPHQVAEDYLGI